MEDPDAITLANKTSLLTVVGWELHWLTCKLHNLMRDMRRTELGTSPVDLVSGRFADFKDALRAVTIEYAELQRKVKIMLRMDYNSEIAEVFMRNPKHPDYLEASQEVASYLQTKAEQVLAQETQRIRDSLADAVKPPIL
jgi:hypothetical protein